MHPDTRKIFKDTSLIPSLISIPRPGSEFYIQDHLQISFCREQMYFQIPYINNFTYILQFICTSIGKGKMHILRPAGVIIVLCSNASYYPGHNISLCNTRCTAISTAVGRENLLVPSSPPSRNCLVSISSAINFSEKQVLSSFLLPSSFSSLFKSTRVGTVDPVWCWAQACAREGSTEELSEAHGLCETVLFPDTCSFLPGNASQGWQRHGKQQELTMMATWGWSLQRTCFSPPGPVVISYVYKFIFLSFSQQNCHGLQNFIKLSECTFFSGGFKTLLCVLQLFNAPVSRKKYDRAKGYLETGQIMFFFHQLP